MQSQNHLKTIGIPIVLSCLQKETLLGTASIGGSLAFQRVSNTQMSDFSPRSGDVIPKKK